MISTVEAAFQSVWADIAKISAMLERLDAMEPGGLGWYDVKAFGAWGNGTTDDTAAIQAAFVACNANGGGTVYFPVGTYIVTDRVFIYDNTRALGAGWASIIQYSPAPAAESVLQANGYNTTPVASVNIIVASLRVSGGAKSADVAGGLISIHTTNRFAVLNCYCDGGNVNGIHVAYSTKGMIYGNHCIDNGGEGIDCSPFNYVTVDHNVVEGADNDGIAMYAGNGAGEDSSVGAVTANIIKDVVGNGVLVGLGNAVQSSLTEHISVTGNIIYSAQQDGIQVTGGAQNITVTGNTIYAPTYYGIEVSRGASHTVAPRHITITGNSMDGGAYGIGILSTDDDVDDVTIGINNVRGVNSSGIVLSASANTVSNINIIGNNCSNGGLTTGGQAGISLSSSGTGTIQDVQIEHNRCWDDQTPKTQAYGVGIVQGGSSTIQRVHVSGNNLNGNLTANYYQSGGSVRRHDNPGYVTENTGIAALPMDGAATTVDWPHGMATTPTSVTAVPQETAGTAFWVPQANIGATTFRITIPAPVGAATAAVGGAVADDGGVMTTETAAANNATANDMTLLPAVPAANDAYYIGATEIFSSIDINIGTPGVGTWTITWEYWNGAAWAALAGVTDGTTGFTAAAGTRNVAYTLPTAWAKTTINTIVGYWIRGRVSAYTNVTTQPLGTQAWVYTMLHYLWRAEAA